MSENWPPTNIFLLDFNCRVNEEIESCKGMTNIYIDNCNKHKHETILHILSFTFHFRLIGE